MNRCSNASKPSIVSPEPMPTTPSSVSTRTIVAANDRRGIGSHAAGNGGSSGTTSRSRRIAVIRTSGVSPFIGSGAVGRGPDADDGTIRYRRTGPSPRCQR